METSCYHSSSVVIDQIFSFIGKISVLSWKIRVFGASQRNSGPLDRRWWFIVTFPLNMQEQKGWNAAISRKSIRISNKQEKLYCCGSRIKGIYSLDNLFWVPKILMYCSKNYASNYLCETESYHLLDSISTKSQQRFQEDTDHLKWTWWLETEIATWSKYSDVFFLLSLFHNLLIGKVRPIKHASPGFSIYLWLIGIAFLINTLPSLLFYHFYRV